jgi:hypothetical protein
MRRYSINTVTESAKNNESGSIHTVNTIKFVCKLATVVAIAILVAITTNNALLAVPPIPPPDCFNTPFIGQKEAIIKVDGCEFKYVYWWRYACNAYYDTYIETIFPPENDPKCKDVFDRQYKTIYDAIMADVVVIQNPWKYKYQEGSGNPPPPPTIPNCNYGMSPTQWRFFRPTCRTAEPVEPYWENGNIKGGYMSCQDNESKLGYCYATYLYCWMEIGNGELVLRSKETGKGTFGQINCPEVKMIVIECCKCKEYKCISNCDEK